MDSALEANNHSEGGLPVWFMSLSASISDLGVHICMGSDSGGGPLIANLLSQDVARCLSRIC